MIVPPSDGPMFILIDWEEFSETVAVFMGLILYSKNKILALGSCGISQKLKQTKCLLGNLAKLVFWSILSLKS